MKILRWLAALLVLSPLSALAQNSTQGIITTFGSTCATAGACWAFAVPNTLNGVSVQISGTFSGTLQFEALPVQPPNGTVNLTQSSIAGTPLAGGAAVTSATAAGTWQFGVGGIQTLIVRASALASGSAVITIGATNGAFPAPTTVTANVAGPTAITAAASSIASGAYAPGSLNSALPDPCSTGAKLYYVVNLTAASVVEIATGVASEFWHICSVNLIAQGANKVILATDNSAGCGSLTAGLNGGTTAATGWSFAADGGGIALGNGMGTVMKGATANHSLCILPSTTAQLSGTIAYVSSTQ